MTSAARCSWATPIEPSCQRCPMCISAGPSTLSNSEVAEPRNSACFTAASSMSASKRSTACKIFWTASSWVSTSRWANSSRLP